MTKAYKQLYQALMQNASLQKAEKLSRFFKTGKGEYGEGDCFMGITVPEIRQTIKKFYSLNNNEIEDILQSKWHDMRLAALLIMVYKFEHGNDLEQKNIFNLYLANTNRINNWDLVDLSCHEIIGAYLRDKNKAILYKLAKSALLWERRIAMVSCYAFIRKGENKTVFDIAKILLKDKEDLIHKAIGWMLRETGKYCSEKELLQFIELNYSHLPRTALRYAIEKFSKEKRKQILLGKF